MGKVAPDQMIDQSLKWVALGTEFCVCSGSPTTYTQAYTTFMLARVEVTAGSTSGSYTIADDTSGRKLTMTAAAGVPITNSGSALAVAIVSSADTTLRYVTTCTDQWLVSGGTVDIPAWKINVADPT